MYETFVGRTFAPFSVAVEPFQLKLFARAIGEERPAYVDDAYAKVQGWRGLLAPPTFLFSLWLQDPQGPQVTAALKLDIRRVLHGEQSFVYEAPIYAGDTITLQERISDVYQKKNGALTFIVSEVEAANQFAARVGTARCATVVRA